MIELQRAIVAGLARGIFGTTEERRCDQCYRVKPVALFVGKRGHMTRRCDACRSRYDRWGSMTVRERMKAKRSIERTGDGYQVAWTARSFNRKTGPIPVSTTDMRSCPPACSFRDRGCYAEHGATSWHWRKMPRTRALPWSSFLARIRALPAGQLWRHNEAGDLPGLGNFVDTARLGELVAANAGRRGFTFTHKPVTKVTRVVFALANLQGFTINLSADSLAHADKLADERCGPVAVVLPADATKTRTPAGRHVIICPAQTHDISCAKCELCANPTRKAIVGFRAHGQSKAIVTELVRSRRRD